MHVSIDVMHHIERGTLWKVHVSHFITMIVIDKPCSFIYILITSYQVDMLTFNRQNPSLLEDLLLNTVNKITKNMAKFDRYRGDEVRHM